MDVRPEVVAKAIRGIPLKPQATAKERGQPGRVARMRDHHHNVARMVAHGTPDDTICRIMGITPSNLELLREQTPAFQELVAYYTTRPDTKPLVEEYLDLKERFAICALHELNTRLAEDPSKFSASELMKGIDDYGDRAGFGKHNVNINIQADLAQALEAQRRRRLNSSPAGAGDGGGALSAMSAALRSAPPLLDLRANEPPLPGPEEPTVPPSPTQTPPSAHPLLDEDRPMTRDEVLALHQAALSRSRATSGYSAPAAKEKIKRRI